ncbi:hypothetical protein AVEN_192996-1 [Araneus ventricosus]|uniref:HAT C-terminal dimerisation domain-containing protein n=1 Tax=Araneus ventricosus TaxID=182803 RepID=A0A4Y2JY95_ARAVE|nr:hypothetical protein AVEN_192996-1 [Araneus ventricosus]
MLLDSSGSCPDFADISKVAFKLRSVLPQTFKVIRLVLTSPLSSASCERSFSAMKLVLNDLRTNMDDERLNSLMLLFSSKNIVDRLDIRDVIKKWIGCVRRYEMRQMMFSALKC